ncbi:hypothetical protein APASM_1228 [Actinosynnema pretiosum subsp. pretiosum]|nr:hypothetical protein APASM_1228 [Actinosynnema pretiosum subsp. pretiosum]
MTRQRARGRRGPLISPVIVIAEMMPRRSRVRRNDRGTGREVPTPPVPPG